MIARLSAWVSPRLATWLAIGVCSSVVILGVFAYRAVREWELTATLLAEQRAQESADMLALALTRDMRGAQESVLSSQDWSDSVVDGSYDLSGVVASAFARFPYPELFFTWPGTGPNPAVEFFGRPDRQPAWFVPRGDRAFPVVPGASTTVESALFRRVTADVLQRRRFSIFDLRVGDAMYQVVARLQYRDPFREELHMVFGFMVNLDWARQHYLTEVARQVARIARPDSSLVFSVRPEKNAPEQSLETGGALRGRRVVPLTFFDPYLIAVDPPPDLAVEQWELEALLSEDPTLRSARSGAYRTLAVVAFGGLGVALGLALTVASTRSHARLAQLRADFVSTVTHELKTPIATIRAAGDTLASGRLTDGDASRRYAQLMVDESKHLTRLLDNLLAYARIADTTEAYSFVPIDVDAIVHQSLRESKNRIETAGFEVAVDIPPDLPPVRADWTAICLALDNLVDNAIRYSKGVRSLRIAAKRDGNAVRIQVIDRGVGIPASDLQHVTRRFFRGRASASGGSGLGLAIVERIVTDHGGSLAISSTVGEGTTAELVLPVAQGQG